MKHRPPKLAEKILRRLQYDDVWKTTLGDFEEYFCYKADKDGIKAANRWYWQQVIQYTPSKITHKLYWSIGMFKNYLKIAYRNILRNKGYSFINIFGLSVGLASFLLLGMFVLHELSYDNFHEDSERTYRLVREAPNEVYKGSSWFGVNPLPLSIALSDNFEGVEYATSFNDVEALFKVNTNSFYEKGFYTDPDFFEVFTVNWIRGSELNAFDRPEALVITQSLAEKYFGNNNPIGQSVFFDSDGDEPLERTITGVVADFPSNSQIEFGYLIPSFSMDGYEHESTYWFNNNEYQYLKLSPEQNPDELISRIEALVNPKLLTSDFYLNNPEYLTKFRFIKAADVHLNSSDINFNPGSIGDMKYVYMLSAVAFVIIIIACFNYMNLATARSMGRAKEVGVRKVNGAFRSNIMMQFSAEAVIFSLIAITIAFAIVYTLLPAFSSLVDREFNPEIFLTPFFWVSLIGAGVIVGLISGSYPAIYMSALKPIGIFKNQIKGGSGNRILRNSLVVAQFAITNILIIGSVVIFQQMNFIKNNDSGYTRDQVLSVTINDPEVWKSYDVLRQRLESNSNIAGISSGIHTPNNLESQTSGIWWEGKAEDDVLRAYNSNINVGYLELLDIEMITGTRFNDEFTDSTMKVILNETMVSQLGWTPEQAVGEYLRIWRQDATVVGVVKDFNFLSYRSEISPLFLRQGTADRHNYLLLKLNPVNLSETIAFVENEIKALSPDYPFEYAFLDDVFNNMYRNEITLGKIFNYFTLLGLIIACLGLFGLASFMMEQRTKEIGIRKVLGANLFQILSLLNKDFIRLVGISLLISIPVGWYLTSNWLKDFAFRIELGVGVFLASSVIAIIIALITVSFKSFQTAKANPVDSLKGE